MTLDNYKFIAYSLIAIAICVSISYGVPNVIHAAKEYNHQGIIDKIHGVDALVKIDNAKALVNFSTLSITLPISYNTYKGNTVAAILGGIGIIGVTFL